jgi:hypothetical protein
MAKHTRKNKSKMFREFNKLPERNITHTGLKHLGIAYTYFRKRFGLGQGHVHLMLLVYDLEFFTTDHACKEMKMYRGMFYKRLILPLVREGYLYHHFRQGSPGPVSMEEMIFRGEGQFNYRSRMALSQKGRLLVGRFYRAAETGIMPDNLDY